MKTITINLYSFDELSASARDKALADHAAFLYAESEAGEDYPTEAEAEDSITINEYLFLRTARLRIP